MTQADRSSGAPKKLFNDEADISPGRVNDMPAGGGLTSEQLTNAAIIYQVGRYLGLSTRDIQIGLITAMVESNLVNVDHGDRDSLGLFQQRPSQGWGTPEQVMDPIYASKKFFESLTGLGERRFAMGMGEAAQAVQRSAFPERYATKIGAMRKFWPLLQKTGGDRPKNLDGGDYFELPPILTGTGDSTPAGMLKLGAVPQDPAVTPSVHAMLGAWGMDNPTLPSAPPGPDVEAMPLISGSTNEQIITPLSQEMGGFEAGVDGWRKGVIEAARTALGQPYVWGGSDLASGVDCSGLIQAAFARVGIKIPRVSYQQANFGKRVGLDALRPGDLVAWDNSSRNVGADHIALYLGNGQIIEAARPGLPVRIRAISGDEGAWGVKLNIGGSRA